MNVMTQTTAATRAIQPTLWCSVKTLVASLERDAPSASTQAARAPPTVTAELLKPASRAFARLNVPTLVKTVLLQHAVMAYSAMLLPPPAFQREPLE